MIYKYATYDQITKEVKEQGKKIVVYGAGMIGRIIIPYIIEEYGLQNNLLFYVDADSKKQEEKIVVAGQEYPIYHPNVLKMLSEDTILFITNSNYFPIVNYLDSFHELNDKEGYIIPVLQTVFAHRFNEKKMIQKKSEEMLIPKKIHYCWFSKNPMPDYLLECIASWEKYCPEYEIIRWDESNYDVDKYMYMKQAYAAKKWGFVPDIARLDILYQHGGIYLDTDVELLKNLDDLLYQPAFVGVEKWGNINVGGCCGSVKGHPVIKKILDERAGAAFLYDDGTYNQTTCGYYETRPLIDMGMKPNNTVQNVSGMTVYSSDFFHPYDYMSGEVVITPNTYSIHHFNGGWLDKASVIERENTKKMYYIMLKRMHVG